MAWSGQGVLNPQSASWLPAELGRGGYQDGGLLSCSELDFIGGAHSASLKEKTKVLMIQKKVSSLLFRLVQYSLLFWILPASPSTTSRSELLSQKIRWHSALPCEGPL